MAKSFVNLRDLCLDHESNSRFVAVTRSPRTERSDPTLVVQPAPASASTMISPRAHSWMSVAGQSGS